MKNNILFLGLSMFSVISFAGENHRLAIEFKHKINCRDAKKILANDKILLECDKNSGIKLTYYGGEYLGGRTLQAEIQDLKKHPPIASVSYDKILPMSN